MSTPFALPGFMPHQSPVASAEELANADGSWGFDTRIPNTELLTKISRVRYGGKSEFVITGADVEKFLDREKTTLRIVCGPFIPEMRALRGDTKIKIETYCGAVVTRIIRQTNDVSAA